MHTHSHESDRGAALVMALIATVLLTGLGVGLVVLSSTETRIASNYRSGSETLYAADAAIERVVQDVLLVPRWNDIVSGTVQSGFTDSTHTPTLPSGELVNLDSTTADLQAATDLVTAWGANKPVWHLFAWGPLSQITGATAIDSLQYVAVWVADDPSETDNDPAADGNGVVNVHAEAYGPGHTRRTVEITIAKTNSTEIERGQIAQRGQEELNQRARKAAVQLPGKALTIMDLNVPAGGVTVR